MVGAPKYREHPLAVMNPPLREMCKQECLVERSGQIKVCYGWSGKGLSILRHYA